MILLSGELGASVVSALKAGASGYLAKDAADRDLVDGIRAAADGRPVIAAAALGHVMDALRRIEEPSPLTPRDRAMLECVAQGNTNEQIARELGHSISTVKAHLAALYAKVEQRSSVCARDLLPPRLDHVARTCEIDERDGAFLSIYHRR